MLRSLLHFRRGQSQQLAPRESPQITNLPQHFRHHLWGTLRRWRHDGYNNISQLVTTTITVYDGTNALGIRYITMVIHAIRHIIHTLHVLLVYSVPYMLYILYVSFWYTTVHDTHQPIHCNIQHTTYDWLHANGKSQ